MIAASVNPVSPDLINGFLAVMAVLVPVILGAITLVGRGMARRADQIGASIQRVEDELTAQGLRLNEATTKVDTLKGALDMHAKSHTGAGH